VVLQEENIDAELSKWIEHRHLAIFVFPGI
jgi:hypothetical protein